MAARKRITEPKETPAPRAGKRGPKPDEIAQKARFLAALRNAGTIRKACDRAKVPRASVHAWLESDEEFIGNYDLAWEDFVDLLLDEMITLGRGTGVGKKRRNFTALVAMLNAFHDDFRTVGRDAIEKRLSEAMDEQQAIAQKFIPPAKFQEYLAECARAADATLLGIRRKGNRE